jgi:1,4-dihydroxy-6-naphthoate synthase
MSEVSNIRLGHSPDADDAFMFYAIAKKKIPTFDFQFEHVVEDIETLNHRALSGELELTAVSFHAYGHIGKRYAILSSGASFGFHYGPIVVTKSDSNSKNLAGKKIAVPGTLTTAFLLLKLYEPNFIHEVVPFDKILQHVYDGKCDAGLLIHEGQLTYGRYKLHKILDLGEWWDEKTALPLPLGCDVVRKDLPREVQRRLATVLKTSIEYAFTNRGDALQYALPFSRGLDPKLADEFVGMYVNEYTLGYDDRAKQAVQKLLEMAHRAKFLKNNVKPEFVEPI